MGTIDVTELLRDPTFVDPCQLVHRTSSVNSLGENVINETIINTYGSVQSPTGATLLKLPEAMRVPTMKSFWINGVIVTDGQGKYPDLIRFKNESYEIMVVFDWSNWGAGFSEGVCVRQRINP